MRFADLEGLSAVDTAQLAHRFRNEDVLTVLPVRTAESLHEALLVATTTMLAILTIEAETADAWTTYWAPWDAVRFAEMGVPVEDEDVFFLMILVHRARFHAELHGETGRRALRDFVVAVESCRAAPGRTR